MKGLIIIMKDEPLLELNKNIRGLENKDASHINGFASVAKIIFGLYEDDGTPIQKALMEYMADDLMQKHKVKSEHSQFKHIVK